MKRVVSGKMVIVMLLVAVAPAFNRDNRHHLNDGGRGTTLSAKRLPFTPQVHLAEDP